MLPQKILDGNFSVVIKDPDAGDAREANRLMDHEFGLPLLHSRRVARRRMFAMKVPAKSV